MEGFDSLIITGVALGALSALLGGILITTAFLQAGFDIPRILSGVGIGIAGPLIGGVIAMSAGYIGSKKQC